MLGRSSYDLFIYYFLFCALAPVMYQANYTPFLKYKKKSNFDQTVYS